MTEGVTVVSDQGISSFVPCVPGKTSDGYHTFDELYEHRCLLFCALIAAWSDRYPQYCWKSLYHDDGSSFEGWFIAGIQLETGVITYHLPEKLWSSCIAKELEQAPKWDGHTSQDVIDRLSKWLGEVDRNGGG